MLGIARTEKDISDPHQLHCTSCEAEERNIMQNKSWLKFIINLSLMFMVLCCVSVLCLAQSDRGSVSGTVTDPTGAGIVGA